MKTIILNQWQGGWFLFTKWAKYRTSGTSMLRFEQSKDREARGE